MKIELTNFSLFRDRTVFDIKPLTFLIGANNSGKSTFIKALAIAAAEHFEGNPYFNIDSIDYHIKDSKKPILIRTEVNQGIFKEFKWTVIDDPEDGSIGYLDLKSVIYLNSKGQKLLELIINANTFTFIDDVANKEFEINFRFSDFLEVIKNEISTKDSEALKVLFGSDALCGKLELPSHLSKIMSDYRPFEKWFFAEGLISFLEGIALTPLDDYLKGSVKDYFTFLFKPISLENNESKINFTTIRNSELSKAKRIYDDSDFIIQQLSKRIGYFQLESIDLDFVDRWMKNFFGESYNIEIITPFQISKISEIKLNGRHLTELGTGICKILQYIHFFGTLSFYSTDVYLNFEEHKKKNTKKFILQKKLLNGFNDAKFVVIEEPETNLHPDFQVLLAEMIYAISNQTKYHVILETHSEYMIRTLQYLVAKNPENSENVGILNFGSGDEIGKVKNIDIEPNGSLSDSFYSNFFHLAEDIKWKISALNQDRLN
jgi:AAA15 family ATPase/GTPase